MTTGTKTTLWIIVLVIIAVGGFYGYKNTQERTAENSNDVQSGTVTETSGKKKAFSQLASEGGSYKCSVSQINGAEGTSGTVYLDNGLVRGEFSGVFNGQKMDSYFILRDGTVYAWNSTAPKTGIKIKSIGMPEGGNPVEQVGDYNCEKWSADASTFTVPTTVTFTQIN